MDLVDVDSHTALHWAALGGNAEVCQMLMENGIGPNVQVLMQIPKHKYNILQSIQDHADRFNQVFTVQLFHFSSIYGRKL